MAKPEALEKAVYTSDTYTKRGGKLYIDIFEDKHGELYMRLKRVNQTKPGRPPRHSPVEAFVIFKHEVPWFCNQLKKLASSFDYQDVSLEKIGRAQN